MDWANETWVKLYTRSTVDDALLTWEARALWAAIFQRLDRSGVLAFGRHGWKGVAVVVGMPVDVVEMAAPELLRDGRIVERDNCIVAPNYIDAQAKRSSDAQRQRDSREKRRAVALLPNSVTERDTESRNVTDESQNVTDESQNVTDCHQPSPGVTACHDKKRAEESRREEKRVVAPKKRSTQIPDSWQPNEKHITKASEDGTDIAEAVESFRDHHQAKGSAMKSWDAAFNTWLRNAKKFADRDEAKSPRGPQERLL